MKRIPVLLALVLLTGGGTSASSATKSQAPSVVLRGSLPVNGLLLSRGRDTLLIGLDGRTHARLVRARASWLASGETARNAAFQQLAQIVSDRILLAGPHRRWYLFDSAGHLEPLTAPRIALPGGLEVVAHTRPTRDGVFDVRVTVERSGRELVPASAELRRISGDLAVGQSVAIDLRTGNRWHLSSDCYAVGDTGADLLMFCTKDSVELVAVSTDGSRRTLATLPKSLYATAAYISPNGRYVAAMFSPGCGPSYGFVVSTDGGVARPLTGESSWSLAGPNSIALGWTPDNRIVAIVQPSSRLERDPRKGVYLIDPATLVRTLVYPSASAWAMWNPAGARGPS